ncbi:hypothetical protein EV284_6417 [Streptomyces sp. BK022]|uniref:hypothetical protein n=1 Tax=Streptomyces sp. BK022 TaxID=2512123 RepID=UPI0010296644|nr:hypothetical protein [Streptomyces sp. BK022]RZU28251.1 hypothetical protein EV284_6417 [Streptomyces sp. BK022]
MSSTEPVPEPEPSRPWRPDDGPAPEVWAWPAGDRPALGVWSAGRWRYAPVLAKQEWPDGTIRYQVEVDLLGDTTITVRLYQWPQPGLRMAHGSRSAKPTRAFERDQAGSMPRRER